MNRRRLPIFPLAVLLAAGAALAQEGEPAAPSRAALQPVEAADLYTKPETSELYFEPESSEGLTESLSPLLISLDQAAETLGAQRLPDERLPLVIDEYEIEDGLSRIQDPSAWVLFRRQCREGEREIEISLFANGTIRVRRGLGYGSISLGQLSDFQFAHFLRSIAGETEAAYSFIDFDLSSTGPADSASETCEIAVRLPERREITFVYGEFDAPPLWVSGLAAVGDELDSLTQPSRVSEIPIGYLPSPGDFLRRRDGSLFQIVGLTTDGKAVILDSPLQPLREYYPLTDIPKHFVSLIRESSLRPNFP